MTLTPDAAAHHDISCQALARVIGGRTPGPGDFDTAIAGLGLFRRDAVAPACACLVEPSIVLVVQGAKQMWIGGQAFPYDTSRFLITSLDLPGDSEVTAATPEHPCLGLALKLDLRILAELIAQGDTLAPRERAQGIGVGIGTATPTILAPFTRLLALLDEPDAIPVLAPLVLREIHYRLLMSDQAARLRQITAVDGQGQRIARAISWLKRHYALPLRVEDLAARVQMSPPTFHHHFRQLTAMSPLQYQKWLRLNEARRLMLNEYLDVASAAFKVGYESPSQFSREYSRLYGVPPKRDIAALRGQPGANPGPAGAASADAVGV
ncbi:AraC family transcriptional regulator [Achromobacter xylosoxidans]|uniref:AraC family transcriptional regulator n=1 Tax=Alcaligenes xylosoxydans xylosoxydans TaxID=85698 RepID=UPI0003320BA2|nr:AraC family transcriptional regulator [Achromobacter xylosoxidans]MCH4591892.1 AraC family transcriptional regulator [Achromobacter xylosoxidans]OFQ49803.1 AraC family transcriptional regulator [Achromobacter xylosoxidans]CCH09876.1 Transcriptional regulator, AraC family [Achromobacter xylosoxidans NH44784-1996]CUI30796.1 L-rhamnose operon regulatory protein rhaS [Achromobacter xylosoxidans]CUJ33498.1 L-rhamnose operon regulatory protein rhaS [Achromobacter xylosoxidans]